MRSSANLSMVSLHSDLKANLNIQQLIQMQVTPNPFIPYFSEIFFVLKQPTYWSLLFHHLQLPGTLPFRVDKITLGLSLPPSQSFIPQHIFFSLPPTDLQVHSLPVNRSNYTFLRSREVNKKERMEHLSKKDNTRHSHLEPPLLA